MQVEYEPLPAILSIEDAIAAGSFLTDGERLHRGDAEAALRDAPQRLEGELHIGGQEHFYLETQPRWRIAIDEGGLIVHSSTQHPSEMQEIVARVLGLPKHAVVVQCLRMGGAFGGKETQANAWAALAALAATKIGRPVRVRLTRHQDMVLTGKRHPFLGALPGRLRRRRHAARARDRAVQRRRLVARPERAGLDRAMFHVDNCYFVPHVDVTGRVCRTHHVSHTAFRGFGGPQGMLVIEEILDRVARGARSAAAGGARAELLSRGRHDALRPGGARIRSASRASGPSCRRPASFEARWAESTRSTRPARTSSAGSP